MTPLGALRCFVGEVQSLLFQRAFKQLLALTGLKPAAVWSRLSQPQRRQGAGSRAAGSCCGGQVSSGPGENTSSSLITALKGEPGSGVLFSPAAV